MTATNLVYCFIGFACIIGIYATYVLSSEIDSLRSRLKDADKRYQQLYAAYISERSSTSSKPRLTAITMTQEQWDAIQKPGVMNINEASALPKGYIPTVSQEEWDAIKMDSGHGGSRACGLKGCHFGSICGQPACNQS